MPDPDLRRPTSYSGLPIPEIGKVNEKEPYALRVKDYETVGGESKNPYFLPWAMRGLLEEGKGKNELRGEMEELLQMFEEWKPVSKQLKDVRFRLEGIRVLSSRL